MTLSALGTLALALICVWIVGGIAFRLTGTVLAFGRPAGADRYRLG